MRGWNTFFDEWLDGQMNFKNHDLFHIYILMDVYQVQQVSYYKVKTLTWRFIIRSYVQILFSSLVFEIYIYSDF